MDRHFHLLPSDVNNMAQDFGNSLSKAKTINIGSTPTNLTNSIGRSDKFDYLRVNLSGRSSFNLKLTKLKANADLALFNGVGQLVAQSRKAKKASETIATVLEGGTYFIRVSAGKRDFTSYRLSINANTITPDPPANTAPVFGTNNFMAISRNWSGVITSSSLKAIDGQQNSSQLVYTLTNLPKQGKLFLNGVALGLNSTFTQADVDSNRLSYKQSSIKELANLGPASNRALISPKVAGNNVVWSAYDGQDYEIYLYNKTTGITQITNDTVDDLDVQIGSNLVWRKGTGTAAEIYFYDGSTQTTRRVTNNSLEDKAPQLSGNRIVWERVFSATDSDIYYSVDGGLTSNAVDTTGVKDTNPLISGSRFVFQRDAAGVNAGDGIYLYSLSGPTATSLGKIADESTSYTLGLNDISEAGISWTRKYSTESDVVYYNGSSSTVINSSTSFDDKNPLVSDSPFVAFERTEVASGATSIQLTNFTNPSLPTTTKLSNNSAVGLQGISGTNVLWWGQDAATGSYDMYLYNGVKGQTTRLSSASPFDNHGSISGNNAAWVSFDGSTYNKVLFYDGNVTNDAFGFTVSDGVGGSKAGTFNFNIS
jgi:hypothetical protein